MNFKEDRRLKNSLVRVSVPDIYTESELGAIANSRSLNFPGVERLLGAHFMGRLFDCSLSLLVLILSSHTPKFHGGILKFLCVTIAITATPLRLFAAPSFAAL
jgi:hypothetical protein